MADIPPSITMSGLWKRLSENADLTAAVRNLRSTTERLAETISRSVPNFTDHSVRHMDALWSVADKVLTEEEIRLLTLGETFLLAVGLYLHDIGMALVCNKEGLEKIRASSPFKEFLERAAHGERAGTSDDVKGGLEAQAVAYAVRKLHAEAALDLATRVVPGSNDIFLLEPRNVRQTWGRDAGRIAASHHWSLDRIEREFGRQGVVPLGDSEKGDPAYVACLLRIIDYAHINHERAPSIDRALRQPLEADSLLHWLAQERIVGPERDGKELVYKSVAPIEDVDAWWLYYGMLTGLNAEIIAVRRYLDLSRAREDRLTLRGVRGASSPEEAAAFIETSGFEPIEVNIRTGSIERVVRTLCGESLYGRDPMAAVRELVQNARDAVTLRSVLAKNDSERLFLGIPIRIKLNTAEPSLEVIDSGIGMSKLVMTDYLPSIASNYWGSERFFSDFPEAVGKSFDPAGKFGIGFLSVFMLGDQVEVESNRDGGERLRLKLRGVGRRGELRRTSPRGSGTAVKVRLRHDVVEPLKDLVESIKAHAPMLEHDMEVEIDGASTQLVKGWWRSLDAKTFASWVVHAVWFLQAKSRSSERVEREAELQKEKLSEWDKEIPEWRIDKCRVLASPRTGMSILCSKGLALMPVPTPGFTGIFDSDDVTPDTSRRRALDFNVEDFFAQAKVALRPSVIGNLDALPDRHLVASKIDFISNCVEYYGREVVLESQLPWISVVRPPGEIKLLSCNGLLRELKVAQRVLLKSGENSWSAIYDWPSQIGASDIAIIAARERSYDRFTRDEERGSLSKLWPTIEEFPLHGVLLRLIAQAWKTTVDELLQQDGWTLRLSTLLGAFRRIS